MAKHVCSRRTHRYKSLCDNEWQWLASIASILGTAPSSFSIQSRDAGIQDVGIACVKATRWVEAATETRRIGWGRRSEYCSSQSCVRVERHGGKLKEAQCPLQRRRSALFSCAIYQYFPKLGCLEMLLSGVAYAKVGGSCHASYNCNRSSMSIRRLVCDKVYSSHNIAHSSRWQPRNRMMLLCMTDTYCHDYTPRAFAMSHRFGSIPSVRCVGRLVISDCTLIV